jgi:F-type H+-transporting ATPase subunit b
MAKASGKAKAALDSARAEAQVAGDEKLAAIKAEAEAVKNAKLTELKAEIDSARTSLAGDLTGFATDMASKILGRSL